MGILETFLFPCLISPIHTVTFVVKKSLITHPIFGPIMRSRDPITVNRENAKEDFQIVMKEGKEKLNNGISIIIFPQSTRTTEFIPENFNSLGVKLAKSAGAKVIPIAIKLIFGVMEEYLKILAGLIVNYLYTLILVNQCKLLVVGKMSIKK
jgi:1-acyl-sn-glycerol-3-phosphate acyltransferase